MDQATTALHLEAIDRDGFTVVRDAIEPDLVCQLRDEVFRLEETTLPAEDRPSHRTVDGRSMLRTAGLLSFGELFQRVPVHENVLPIVEGVLGGSCLLTAFSGIDILPGKNRQPLHGDDALIPVPKPHKHPIVCTTMWALVDFTEENGATRYIAGTHRKGDPDYTKHYETDCLEMPAGSVCIFDAALWHRSGENTTENERRLGLQVSYCAPYIRPFTNYFLSIPRETARTFSDKLLELLGYSTYRGIGTVVKPGTHRHSEQAHVRPASVLGR
jgi:ectoine hydroxylase-related dioxygenase (phytanoyl-CoA dioxygenase family)